MSEITNKVASSGIITLDPEALLPAGKKVELDIRDQLWQGLALKEKDFRTWIAHHPWTAYTGCHVAVTCSADAIIPNWAYMLVASKLTGIAHTVVFGNRAVLLQRLAADAIDALNPEDYQDKRVVVKGCSGDEVPVSMYVDLVGKLQPVVKSLMFGEPCSTVPIFKKTT